jgi:hypothetical protein
MGVYEQNRITCWSALKATIKLPHSLQKKKEFFNYIGVYCFFEKELFHGDY